MDEKEWIGVDLDGTLAEYHGWKGPNDIGRPITEMVERVKRRIEEGETFKIFTARASKKLQIPPIRKWLKEVGLPDLEITCKKDFYCKEIWDDRARGVISNTGRFCCGRNE